MSEPTDMGMNRTGMGMAPSLGKEMVDSSAKNMPAAKPDGQLMAQVRHDYAAGSPPLGHTPPPASAKGVVQAGAQMIKGQKPNVFIDKLGERLAFERTGTRLYDALLTKFDTVGGWEGGPSRSELQRFRDEELQHFEMMREAIESLGGDPTAMTPSADVAGVASEGIVKIITDPRTTLAESLHALQVAELTDNDGWEMLIGLAKTLGQDELAGRFQSALAQEQKHLAAVRQWLSMEVRQEATRDLEPSGPGQPS